MKKLVLALILFVCLLNTSCSSTNHVPSSQVKFLYVKVFQTLSRTEALARCRDNYGFSGDVVKVISYDEPLFDGKELRGGFVFLTTYSYETVPDEYGRTFMKTVPVYINRFEYPKYKKDLIFLPE